VEYLQDKSMPIEIWGRQSREPVSSTHHRVGV